MQKIDEKPTQSNYTAQKTEFKKLLNDIKQTPFVSKMALV
jgi:hypothetical protein